ncbi:hypothetical protein [Parasphingorhabdus cellanae]|uniref:TonB C-terminal domain-containing protein n=1 Tax=Parasphingorhabdus cellanae TaxID=2806553 RepID=A0ABX7T142_9SPHN|nr:hypothetical protein [Parasphingorhabdus cellanae]QTD55276.1 hypothetical protein J4G78_13765 [Parasphingorhabdus cellanae]
MIDLLFAMALASTTTQGADTISAMPADYSALETAQFSKPIYYAQRHEMAAERAAKKANCKLPTAEQWVYARIEAAILVAPDGELVKVVPVESGCRELEVYMVNHLSKYGKKAGPISTNNKTTWYKTAMHFRWPE